MTGGAARKPAGQAAGASGRRRLVSAETTFKHLLRMSRALAGQLEFQSAIQAVSEEVAHFLPHDHLDVCLPLHDMHVAYEAGLHTAWGLNKLPMPISTSPIRDVLRGVEPLIITGDAINDARFHFPGAFNHPIFDQNLRSRLHVPLLVKGEIIGALSCSKHDAHFYTGADVPVAQHVADMLAPYFHALRAVGEAQRSAIIEAEGRAREEALREGALRLTEALERERQRIGMDLHDQTLADITRITRSLTRLQERSAIAPEALDPAVLDLSRCMGELRQIIDDARPNVLQLFGFAEGIEDLLARALQDSGTGIRSRLIDNSGGLVDRLDEDLRVSLFRIVQEAVNNAAHHATPSLIEVQIGATAGAVTIEIRDDGIGLAVHEQRKRIGGIRNMQTRARLVSAECGVAKRTDGPGTVVTLVLPVRSGAAEC